MIIFDTQGSELQHAVPHLRAPQDTINYSGHPLYYLGRLLQFHVIDMYIYYRFNL